MKTSTFIRNSIDKYLHPENNLTSGWNSPYLCDCLEFYEEHPEVANSSEIIDRFKQLLREDGVLGFGLEYNLRRSGISSEEGQGIRFMYAEFIALYFEDLGD